MNNIQLINNVPPAQVEHFGVPNNGNDDDGINGNNDKYQNNNKNKPNQVSENDDGSMKTYYDHNYDNAAEDNKKIIITQKMKKMMITTLMNLKMMIKIQIILIHLKNLQVEQEEETDVVFIDPYPAPIA